MQTVATRLELEQLFRDDVPYGDLTTEALGIGHRSGEMSFAARDAMVLALAEDAAVLIGLSDCQVDLQANTGAFLKSGDPILRARGPAAALLRSWKVAQTLIEVWSGVASSTRSVVDAARSVSPDVAVACTRKTTPGTKHFAVAAVKAGGGILHRHDLSETVLVFPEHVVFMQDEPLSSIVARLRRVAPEKKLIIEVTSIDSALAAAGAGFDVIQAEKFSPADISALRASLVDNDRRPIIAAAGGINAANATAYAAAGADVLVTSSPYRANSCDVQVRFSRLGV